MPPPTSQRRYNVQLDAQPETLPKTVHYAAIHWLNDDVLLAIFNFYRLDDEHRWNSRLLWCKLSHVHRRWRHLIYEFAFHLDMHIECTNGSPIVGTLDHLPPLPLFINYTPFTTMLTEQDELGIYHALRLHGRVRRIELVLWRSVLQKVFMLMGEHFPILEHLSLSYATTIDNSLPLTLPKGFVAPNLRHLGLPGISPPRRLRVLTSTDSLVKLVLSNIQASSYFRPRLLVARLSSLPLLEELVIGFSIPIPRPSTERELLGEGAPVILPGLKALRFKGVGAYLESLVAQIRVPLLERLEITLFNQIAYELPHLSSLINITEAFKLPNAAVDFDRNEVYVTMVHDMHDSSELGPLSISVICEPFDWQIDCAVGICHALITALSGVEDFMIGYPYGFQIPTTLENDEIDGTTWHELLRSFIGMKELYINEVLLEELSRALQVDEVGLDPGFLPNLRSIHAANNLFTAFIDTRQALGRPVQFSRRW